MKIISTKFSELKVIKSKNHRDSRGFFKEDFKKKFFKGKKFVFGCTSSSQKNVIRGLHLQTKFSQGKYISVLKGKIFHTCWFCPRLFRFKKGKYNLLLLYKL